MLSFCFFFFPSLPLFYEDMVLVGGRGFFFSFPPFFFFFPSFLPLYGRRWKGMVVFPFSPLVGRIWGNARRRIYLFLFFSPRLFFFLWRFRFRRPARTGRLISPFFFFPPLSFSPSPPLPFSLPSSVHRRESQLTKSSLPPVGAKDGNGRRRL